MGYFLLVFFFGILPSAIVLYFAKDYLDWQAFTVTTAIIFVVAFISDYIGIQNGLWIYGTSDSQTVGLAIAGVPIEDLVFFLTIPPWIIGGYEILKNKRRKRIGIN
ncbi:MAG: hypothetical protein UY63_C0002G0018 [Parcubacteria group bacterium GW2011_GWA2_51_10]|nr:MAG: hypothetical protein UY63_C0002G0018 [Parcubacteria group bacterium GW2011_GWA2_51_10]